MKLLACLLAFLAFILTGFSWKCVVYYSVLAFISWWLIYVFLSSKYELDFEVVFKVFEWFGYGVPHLLENRSLSSAENFADGQPSLSRIPDPISKRIDVVIQNISRDFVASWYREVAEGDVFIEESKAALQILSLEIYNRMANLDSHYLSEQVIMVFHAHIERFNKAVFVLKGKDPNLKLTITSSQLLHQIYESQIPTKHLALKNPSSELNYLRTVVDSLLAALLPPNIFSCDMGRFILREILAVQLVDLVDMLCDADWVNEAVIDLLSPPKKQLSDVLKDQEQDDQKSSDETIKKGLGSIGNFSSISPAVINGNMEAILPRGAEGKIISSQPQVRIFAAEGQHNADLEILDNNIKIKDMEYSLDQGKEQLGSHSDPIISENTKASSDAVNGNGNSQEEAEKDLGTLNTGLSSSWGYLPSSGDKTFQTQSFEAMKQEAIERERLKNSSTKFVDFGYEMKRLGTCCTRFDVSDEVNGSLKNKFVQMRKRTASLPEELDIIGNGIDQQDKMLVSSGNKRFQRSVSFPSSMSSILESDQPLDQVERPLRSSTIHPTPVYGSPYYNISFCGSDGSFKSFSDDEINVEEGEEMDEGTDSDDNEILEDIAPLPIVKVPSKSAITTEIDHANSESNKYRDNIRQRKLGFVKSKDIMHDSYQGNAGMAGSNDESYGKNSFDSYHDNRYSSKDSDSSDPRSPMETTSKSRRLESDPSFSDSVILAGKKFISSIKSPVKKFGFSSGSSKSTSTSSGADSMEVNVPSSIDTASFDSDLPFHRPIIKTKTDSPSSGRKLSRSQAVVDVSSESETETWYGTPTEAVKEEIVYGVPSSSSGDTTDSDSRTVKKIHPSKLISIPSSETALESEWEPGRSKFTLYRIEYDIRIWPSVYKAEIEEESHLQSTEEKEEDSNKKKTIPYKRAIKRRYREFMELHSRLCSGSVATYMKDILKPNRKYNLPFGRLDKEVVEGRRCLLQNYLVSLVSKPQLRDCDDLKQFLGVIDGVSFIKPSVAQIMSQSVHVPRVDKMLSRQMTKVIDSIKTALELEDQAEPDPATKAPATLDTSCPWTIIHHSSVNEQPLMEKEELSAGDCFSAFLDSLELSTSHLTYNDNDTDDSYEVSSGDDDDDDDDDDDLYLLGPKTVDYTSDTPNKPSTTSPISQDDMLNGILGSKPPGLCIPSTLPHSISTGSLNDKDTIDFGKQWFHKDIPEKKPKPVPPEKPAPPALSPPHPGNEPIEPAMDQGRAKFSHQLKFSKKNVEKLKVAAQKAKEKKIESMENLSHAKEKVKMFSKEKTAETAEHLSQAKDKVKTFSKEKQMETVEHLSHTKDKVKAFSKEKKFDSVEQFTDAKEKVKNFSKDKKAETAEHLSQAKEKMKSFSKEAKFEPMEQLSRAKDKVKAYSKEIKVETMDSLDQAKEKVKEKKIETAEHLSNAKDKMKAYSKEKKEESLENLHQAKEKVKAFQKKISDSKKLFKKEHTGQSLASESGNQVDPRSILVETSETTCTSKTREKISQDNNVNGGRTDIICAISSSDDQRSVNEVTQDAMVEELQCPLAHAILDLTCEVLKGHDSWASVDRVQDAFLGSFGALFEWFVRSEIDDLFTDDNWGLYLENLIQVVWPDGKLIEPSGEQKAEEEKEKTKRKAIKTLMEFFPDLFPLCIGTQVYKDCASNAVESLQNTAINRILIYILLELFLLELIPEMQHIMYMEGQEHPE